MVNRRPLEAPASARWRPSAKCCLSNTRPKTALRSVQNASLSLPVGTCALVWACDGGGHPKVALSGHSGAYGTTKATERAGVRGAKGTFQGEQRPRRSIPPKTTYGG